MHWVTLWSHWWHTPHSPGVRDGAHAEEEHGGAEELVHEPAQPAEVRRREGGEYPGRVRDWPVSSRRDMSWHVVTWLTCTLPGRAHTTPGCPSRPGTRWGRRWGSPGTGPPYSAAPKRKWEHGGIVIPHLPPWKLAHTGHGHGDGGVEVAPRHAPRHHHAQHHADTPSMMQSSDHGDTMLSQCIYPQLMVKVSP